MEIFLLATVGVVVTVGMFLRSLARNFLRSLARDNAEALRDVAEAMGLSFDEARPEDGAAGPTEPGHLIVRREGDLATVELRVSDLPKDITIDRAGGWGRSIGGGTDDVAGVGDVAFDHSVVVRGPAKTVAVILDERARTKLMEGVVQHHMRVDGGTIFWSSARQGLLGLNLLERVEAVVALAHALSARGR